MADAAEIAAAPTDAPNPYGKPPTLADCGFARDCSYIMEFGDVVFVREKDTLRFLNGQGEWIRNFQKAAIFNSTWEASDFCLKRSLHNAEIVLRTVEPMRDLMLEVR